MCLALAASISHYVPVVYLVLEGPPHLVVLLVLLELLLLLLQGGQPVLDGLQELLDLVSLTLGLLDRYTLYYTN